MCVMLMPQMFKSFKNLFKNKVKTIEECEKELKNIINNNDSLTASQMKGVTFIFLIIYSLYYTGLYLMAAIYVNEMIFTAASALFIMLTWKSFNNMANYINTEDSKYLSSSNIRRIGWMAYMGYLLNYIAVNWNM